MMEETDNDKHSSLQLYRIDYRKDSFMIQAPGHYTQASDKHSSLFLFNVKKF